MAISNPLDPSLWNDDLTTLFLALANALSRTNRLLNLAAASGSDDELCDTGIALLDATGLVGSVLGGSIPPECRLRPEKGPTLGEQLRPFLLEVRAVHQQTGEQLHLGATPVLSACELVLSLVKRVAYRFLLPSDKGGVLAVRAVTPTSETAAIRQQLLTAGRFDLAEVRGLLRREIGLAAEFRLNPVTDITPIEDQRALRPRKTGARTADRDVKELMAIAELAIIGPNATRIAEKIGVPRPTLLSWPRFRERYEKAKTGTEARKLSRRRGRRASNGDFEVEG